MGDGIFRLLLLLVASAQFALAFHHHEDVSVHDDCPVCEIGHQGAVAPDIGRTISIVLPERLEDPIGLPRLVAPFRAVLSRSARGPPSLA